MKVKETLIKSIMAGLCIGIGGACFLAIDNKIIGALFFTIGLFTICTRGYALFTGRVGYAFDNDLKANLNLILIWVGNLIGTNLVAVVLRFTRIGSAFVEKASGMCDVKAQDGILSLFILGIFCNMLMYIAVDGFKTNEHHVGKYIGLFLGVAGFILCGFEHCIADMFYFGMAWCWNPDMIFRLMIITLGNVVGGLLLPGLTKVSMLGKKD